jgi:hypothetical protein
MNELDRYARSWGATAVPFGPLSDLQWVAIPSQQRVVTSWTRRRRCGGSCSYAAATLQQAMEQVPGLAGLTRHNS